MRSRSTTPRLPTLKSRHIDLRASVQRRKRPRRGCAGVYLTLVAIIVCLAAVYGMWDSLVRYPRLEAQRQAIAATAAPPSLEDAYTTHRVIITAAASAPATPGEPVLETRIDGSVVYLAKDLQLDQGWIVPDRVAVDSDAQPREVTPDASANGAWANFTPFRFHATYDAQLDSEDEDAAWTPGGAHPNLRFANGFFDAPTTALAEWDRMLADSSVVGLPCMGASPDPEALAFFGGFVAAYALVPDLPEVPDPSPALEPLATQLLDALGKGHIYTAFDWLTPAHEVVFVADAPGMDGGMAIMGDTIPFHRGIAVHAEVPVACQLRLLRNGEPVVSIEEDRELSYSVVEPGVYRLEAAIRLGKRLYTWVVTNPIHIR